MRFLAVFILATLVLVVNCKSKFGKYGKFKFGKSAKLKCKDAIFLCKCGDGKSHVGLTVQQCKVKNETTGIKTCELCNKDVLIEHPCERLKHCLTCTTEVNPKCSTCPPGRYGNLCNEEKTRPGMKTPIPHKIRIIRGSAAGDAVNKRRRLVREAEAEAESGSESGTGGDGGDPASDVEEARKSITTCKLPADPMKTNEIDCVIYPDYVNCTQKCVYGHTFPEGQSRTLTCKDDDDVWLPVLFEECDPFASCTQIKLQEPGKVYCVSHMMHKKSWCEVQCFAFEQHKKTNWQRSECNLDSTWSPRLPFCARADEDMPLVTAPARIHKIGK